MKKFIIAILLMVAGAQAQSINVKSINSTRYTDQYAAGSNTGGIVEAYAACPAATGCTVVLGTDVTISTPQTLTIGDNKPLVLNLNGHAIIVTNSSGIGLTFTDNNINTRTRFRIEHGVMACTWSSSSLTGYKLSAMTEVSMEDVKVQNCDHSGTAMLWDDVEDASMKDVVFRSNGLGLQLQNATNQVAFDNVHWDSNVNAVLVKDAGGTTFKDCLVQSNTGQHAFSAITTAGNNATELRIVRSHFENNGDGSAASRQIFIAPAASQVYLNVTITENTFSAGANAPSSIPVEFAGSQNVQPINMSMNQYNGYSGATYTGGSIHLLTGIGENGTSNCDVCINSNGTQGILFNSLTNNRKFQIFGGYSGNFQGFLQFWDVNGNASILAYNSGSNQWQTPKNMLFLSGGSVNGFSDVATTLQWSLDSTTGLVTSYHGYVDASNFERVYMGYSSGDSQFHLQTDKLGSGTSRSLYVGTAGASALILGTGQTDRWEVDGTTGAFQAGTDNTTDIGKVGSQRPRTVYAATSVITPLITLNGVSLSAFQGNGSKIQLSTGLFSSGKCVEFDANGNTVPAVSNLPCGSGGSAFQTNTTPLTSATTINFQSGTNITVSNPSAGNVAFNLSGQVAIANGGTGTSSTLTGLVRGSASAMTASELSGDAVTTGNNTVVNVKLNGVAYAATPATHSISIITAANTATAKVIPDCPDSAGNHLNFTQSGDTITCGNTSSGSGSGTVTHTGSLTATNIILGNGTADVTASIVTIDGSGNISTTGTLTAANVITTGVSQFDGIEGAAPAAPSATHWLFYPLTSLGFGQEDSAGTKTYIGAELTNLQTGTTYTVVAADRAKLVSFNNASSVAVTVPQAGTTGFPNGFVIHMQNRGAGTVTITPTTSTIDGAANLAITQGQGVEIVSDGTNYYTMRGIGGGGGSSFSTITVTGGAGTLATFTGGAATSTNNLMNCTDTTSNTGTGYCMAITTASSSALNGLKINRGASGTGTKAISVQNNASETFSVDFLGNLVANSLTFNTLATSTLNDANGNAFLKSSATASAVDGLTITAAAAANPATVKLAATGSDSNINFEIDSKGTGKIQIGSTAFTVDSSGNLVTTGNITASGFTSSVAAPIQIPTGTAVGALANTITIASDTGDVPKIARGGNLFIEIGDVSTAQTFSNKTFSNTITSTLGTVVSSTPRFSSTATWNSGGVTFINDFVNITATASAASSLLMKYQVNSSNVLTLDKFGNMVLAGTLTTGGTTSFSDYTDGSITTGAGTAVRIGSQNGGSGNGVAVVAEDGGGINPIGVGMNLANEGTTGTLLNGLAKINSSGQVLKIAITDVGNVGFVGVVVQGAGTTGNALLRATGKVKCVFENSATAGHWVVYGTSTAGNCRDSGLASTVGAPPNAIGIAGQTAAAGTLDLILIPQPNYHQHLRTSTGSIAGTTRTEVVVSWPSTFTDSNYTAVCSVEDSTTAAGTQGLTFERIRTKSATQVGLVINNPTGGGITGTIDCSGDHEN
jgi:hypothetical protein